MRADHRPGGLPPAVGGYSPAAEEDADWCAGHDERWGLGVLNSSQGLVEPLRDGPEPPERPVRPPRDPRGDGGAVRARDEPLGRRRRACTARAGGCAASSAKGCPAAVRCSSAAFEGPAGTGPPGSRPGDGCPIGA